MNYSLIDGYLKRIRLGYGYNDVLDHLERYLFDFGYVNHFFDRVRYGFLNRYRYLFYNGYDHRFRYGYLDGYRMGYGYNNGMVYLKFYVFRYRYNNFFVMLYRFRVLFFHVLVDGVRVRLDVVSSVIVSILSTEVLSSIVTFLGAEIKAPRIVAGLELQIMLLHFLHVGIDVRIPLVLLRQSRSQQRGQCCL